MTPTQMGQRIRRLRKSKGWSQYVLAREAGISREHIRRLEAGESDPTLGMLTKLSRALGVTLVDLVK
jgi:XRE family transcriptional regulator, regulator of sulfur utilization